MKKKAGILKIDIKVKSYFSVSTRKKQRQNCDLPLIISWSYVFPHATQLSCKKDYHFKKLSFSFQELSKISVKYIGQKQ